MDVQILFSQLICRFITNNTLMSWPPYQLNPEPIQALQSIPVISVKSTAHSVEKEGLKTQAVLKHCQIKKIMKHRQKDQANTWSIRKAMQTWAEPVL
jgi:hypothetical protein